MIKQPFPSLLRYAFLLLMLALGGIGNAIASQMVDSVYTEPSTRSDSSFTWLLLQHLPSTDFALPANRKSIAMLYSQAPPHHSVRFGWQQRSEGAPIMVQEGTSEKGGIVEAFTLFRNKRSAAYAQASYQNSFRRGIQLNNAEDYELLAPYVMGDTVPDTKLRREQYRFNGAVAYNYAHWSWGLHSLYRGTISYHNVDPRPKNLLNHIEVTSEIAIKAGRVGNIALRGTIGTYKQTNELLFMSELGASSEYHFTGLSQDYFRYRGGNTSNFYRGKVAGAALHFYPIPEKHRFAEYFAGVEWQYFTFEKIINDLNKLPMARALNHTLNAETGGMLRLSCDGKLGAKARFDWQKRLGFENVFGDPASAIFPQIASFLLYEREVRELQLSFFGEYCPLPAFTTSLQMGWGIYKDRERYLYPKELSEFVWQEAFASLKGAFLLPYKWSILLDLGANFRVPNISAGQLTLVPDEQTMSLLLADYKRKHYLLAKSAQTLRLNLVCSKQLNSRIILAVYSRTAITCLAGTRNLLVEAGAELLF